MILGRIFGWILVVAGLLVLAWDLRVSYAVKHWAPIALGQLWYDLSRSSLYITQAAVQRYISPRVWDIFATLLLCWAFVVLTALGIALLLIFHRRRDRVG